MQVRRIAWARWGLYFGTAVWFFVVLPLSLAAAPYAAYVVDARTGEVLHSKNANTRLHPASLTKMMTLYVVFEAVRQGELSMDTVVRVSKHAASEPPSKLGLRPGQRIKMRFLVRAAAVKSANDAATAIAEAVSGSEAAFARRMNATAKALGMTRTNFRNAHGLTQDGHLSTAHDMTILGRHLLYDFPEYYNLFKRRTTHAGVKAVSNTNRRLLDAYKGADGIKTGYTRAAGFNLVASAQRGQERVIATVFGGKSSTSRNAKVAELLDLGFRKAPSRAPLRKPVRPDTIPTAVPLAGSTQGAAGKTIRVSGVVSRSLRPRARAADPVVVADAGKSAALKAGIAAAVADAAARDVERRPSDAASIAGIRPEGRPKNGAFIASLAQPDSDQEVVTRLSTSGGHHWGINVGRYSSHYQAEKVLIRTALSEISTLDGTLRKVVRSDRGFDAHFLGMTRDQADLACRRLQARKLNCFMIGPG